MKRDEGADALGCPRCGRRVELHRLLGDDAVREYGCGAEVGYLAVCIRCEVAFSRDVWQAEKGIQSVGNDERYF